MFLIICTITNVLFVVKSVGINRLLEEFCPCPYMRSHALCSLMHLDFSICKTN